MFPFEKKVKLLMQWDIRPEREHEYFEFVVREWVPGITRMGLEPTDAWLTAYSRDKKQQILAGLTADDLESMRRILASKEWQHLQETLLDYIFNYEQRLVRVTGGFQMI